MNQIIPDTDNLTVAKVAAALALALGAREHEPRSDPLKDRLERFKEAYQTVDGTVAQDNEGRSKRARARSSA
jgi:hypothetical protein